MLSVERCWEYLFFPGWVPTCHQVLPVGRHVCMGRLLTRLPSTACRTPADQARSAPFVYARGPVRHLKYMHVKIIIKGSSQHLIFFHFMIQRKKQGRIGEFIVDCFAMHLKPCRCILTRSFSWHFQATAHSSITLTTRQRRRRIGTTRVIMGRSMVQKCRS